MTINKNRQMAVIERFISYQPWKAMRILGNNKSTNQTSLPELTKHAEKISKIATGNQAYLNNQLINLNRKIDKFEPL